MRGSDNRIEMYGDPPPPPARFNDDNLRDLFSSHNGLLVVGWWVLKGEDEPQAKIPPFSEGLGDGIRAQLIL